MQIFVDADACPVVAMALRKGAYAIHQSGKWYTNDKNVKQGLQLFLQVLCSGGQQPVLIQDFLSDSGVY